jgi:hypothetical protein
LYVVATSTVRSMLYFSTDIGRGSTFYWLCRCLHVNDIVD